MNDKQVEATVAALVLLVFGRSGKLLDVIDKQGNTMMAWSKRIFAEEVKALLLADEEVESCPRHAMVKQMAEALRLAQDHLREDVNDVASHPLRDCPTLTAVRVVLARYDALEER